FPALRGEGVPKGRMQTGSPFAGRSDHPCPTMAEGNCLLRDDSSLILRRETELEQTGSGLVDSVQCDHWHGRGCDGRGLFNHGLVEWSNHTACTQRKRVAGGRFDADGLFGDRKKTQGGTSRRGFL